jgi:hypothetical protein
MQKVKRKSPKPTLFPRSEERVAQRSVGGVSNRRHVERKPQRNDKPSRVGC